MCSAALSTTRAEPRLGVRGRRRDPRGRALIAVALVAGAAEARGDVPVEVLWVAPEGCPSAAEVSAKISRLLAGSTKLAAEAAHPVARARVERTKAELRVVVTLSTGERTLGAESCAALAEATALIVALSIDPERVAANANPTGDIADSAPATSTRAEPAGPPPSVSSAAPALPPRADAPAPASPVPAARRPAVPAPTVHAHPARAPYGWSVSVNGGVGTGRLPRASPVIGADAALRSGRTRFSLGGAFAPAQTTMLAAAPSSGGTFSAETAAARVCHVPLEAFLQLAGCAGLELDRIRGEAVGVTSPGAGTAWVLAPTLGLALELPIADLLAIRLDGSVAAPVSRPEFAIADGGAVHRPSPLFTTATAALSVTF